MIRNRFWNDHLIESLPEKKRIVIQDNFLVLSKSMCIVLMVTNGLTQMGKFAYYSQDNVTNKVVITI